MLMNGSFENWTNGVPDGWTLEQGYIEQATHKYSGSYSAKLSSADQKLTYLVSDPVSLEGVKWCQLTYADYSYENNEVRFEAAYSADGDSWTNYKTLITNTGVYPTTWKLRKVQFFPPSDMNYIRLRIYSWRNYNSNFVDSIELIGSDTVEVDLDVSKGAVELATAGTFCPLNITVKASGDAGKAEDALVTRQFPNGKYSNHRVTEVGNGAFCLCTGLTEVDLPGVTLLDYKAFCASGLTNPVFPKVETVGDCALSECMSLTSVEFGNLKLIKYGAFELSTKLEALYLRGNTVCALEDTGAFFMTPIGNGTGYIYVPEDLYGEYRAATNWSSFADQLRPI